MDMPNKPINMSINIVNMPCPSAATPHSRHDELCRAPAAIIAFTFAYISAFKKTYSKNSFEKVITSDALTDSPASSPNFRGSSHATCARRWSCWHAMHSLNQHRRGTYRFLRAVGESLAFLRRWIKSKLYPVFLHQG